MTSPVEIHSMTWNVTPDLLGILNDDGVFIETNPSWKHTLGWDAEEIIERTFFDFLHPDDIATNASAFAEIKTGKPILNFENRYRHKDGTYRWLSWNAVPEGSNYFCSARDVTLSKNNAASLKSREEEALLREQFVAVLGHDLRNPLASIRSAMSIMGRHEHTDQTRQLIEAVEGSVDRMTALIADVMDFARSKLGAGLEISTSDGHVLSEIVAQAVDEIAMAHPGRVIDRDLAFDGAVACDKTRMAQLASNLLGNAISHGDPGAPIKVSLSHADEVVKLQVTNGGPPIPADKLDTIFEPFHSNEPDLHRKGLGLGLFIVSQIAKGHGGEMTVSSDDTGTVFEFTMPVGSTT